MKSISAELGKRYWRLLVATSTVMGLVQMPMEGQTGPKAAQEKSVASKLPELPAKLAEKLKPIGNGRVFVVAAPRSQTARRSSVRPPIHQPPVGGIPRLACSHDTVYNLQAIYPILVCHPLAEDIEAATSGNFTTGTPSPTQPSSSPKRPLPTLKAEPALRYRVRTSAAGLLVCHDLRMPVLAYLERKNNTCENPNSFFYQLDIAGVSLQWSGDPEVRPADLILIEPRTCMSDIPTSCSGASTCTPLCSGTTGPTPTPVPPPALR